MHHLATVHARDNQPNKTNDHITPSAFAE